jgi:outer membrane protein TolC
MSRLRFSIREILLVTLIVAILLGWGAQTYLRKWPTAREKALMQERLDALKEVVEIQKIRMTHGVEDNSQAMCDAQTAALAAELELCESKEQRLKVLEKNLEVQQQFEKIAQARFQAAAGTRADVLTAKAARLDAEIALEKEKAGR